MGAIDANDDQQASQNDDVAAVEETKQPEDKNEAESKEQASESEGEQ